MITKPSSTYQHYGWVKYDIDSGLLYFYVVGIQIALVQHFINICSYTHTVHAYGDTPPMFFVFDILIKFILINFFIGQRNFIHIQMHHCLYMDEMDSTHIFIACKFK